MNYINSIELFAGCGGMALGFEKAGFKHLLLNENNLDCINTLKNNNSHYNIDSNDIKNINFSSYKGKVDIITGGFPCQSFSHSGKRLGFNDTRGTLFYEFARAIKEIEPICFLAENVKGLKTHDKGNTLSVILNTFKDLDYHVFEPFILNSNDYEVAQKRERIFIFGIHKKYYHTDIKPPIPTKKSKIFLKDIFLKGNYYSEDVSFFNSLQKKMLQYPQNKKIYFEMIPEGGNWKNLNETLQKEYLGKMFFSEGGKTGILKKLSMNCPSVTLLTNPSQKQTERCHPTENRPLTIPEYARIQSFPEQYTFFGSLMSQYKQIGNAVPVNLAYHIAIEIKKIILTIKKTT